jgi:hypothetical protein
MYQGGGCGRPESQNGWETSRSRLQGEALRIESKAMAAEPFEGDVATYKLVHQLLGSPLSEGQDERRYQRRRPFAGIQSIAPCDGASMPPASAFRAVQCHDVSEGGFSFLMPVRPDFAMLVAALSAPPSIFHMVCEVAHCTPAVVHRSGLVERIGEDRGLRISSTSAPSGDVREMYLVGCRFLRRIE